MPAMHCCKPSEAVWKLCFDCRGRTGGLQTQLVFGFMHAFTHFAAAVLLMVLLELGVETCIKCVPVSGSTALPGARLHLLCYHLV